MGVSEYINEGIEKIMNDMTIKFANALVRRRKELGLTQDELAEKVGTTKQVVSKYELGQRSPKVIMANAFAAALGTTLDEMLGVEPPSEDEARLEALRKNPKLCKLFDRIRRMSDKDIDFMIQMADRILASDNEEVEMWRA